MFYVRTWTSISVKVFFATLLGSLHAVDVEGWGNIETIPESYFKISTGNVLRCGKLCERQEKCATATFDSRERMCYMHAANVPVYEDTYKARPGERFLYKKYLHSSEDSESKCDKDVELILPSVQENESCKAIKGCPPHLKSLGYMYNASVDLCWKLSDKRELSRVAKTNCEREGTHLFLDTTVYHDVFVSTIKSKGKSDVLVDGTFDVQRNEWVSWDNKAISWIPWGRGEPNNKEACLSVVIDDYFSPWGAADWSCSSYPAYYACQTDTI